MSPENTTMAKQASTQRQKKMSWRCDGGIMQSEQIIRGNKRNQRYTPRMPFAAVQESGGGGAAGGAGGSMGGSIDQISRMDHGTPHRSSKFYSVSCLPGK